MSQLSLYNSLTKKKENFNVSGTVKMYNCGPTVYDYVHLGNLRYFVGVDILRRYLEYKGYKVKQVMNITDVGHLMADADEGEDKIEAAARRAGVAPKDITKKYTQSFFEDIDALNIKRAWKYPRATENIKEMIAMIGTLLKKDIAYRDGCNVYYDLSKFSNYGHLSGNTVKDLLSGARVEVIPGKRASYDFALWICKGGHLQQWKAPWGTGYPGWHIECSAMARKYLGDTIDIHTGGEDNKFPHHEAEIAQSEGATGKKFVRHWQHIAHLLVEGEKMSKSLGNFYTLKDILSRNASPREVRYLLSSVHYRDTLNFTFASLLASGNALARYDEFWSRLAKAKRGKAKVGDMIAFAKTEFEEAMDDDLNVSKAFAALWSFIRKANSALDEGLSFGEARKIKNFLKNIDSVLGLGFKTVKVKEVSKEVKIWLKERESARDKKDFKTADAMRDKIRQAGFEVEDTETGQELKKI